MRFLKSAVYGVSCESRWVQETIRRFIFGKCQHVGITDPNHKIKNNRYQNLGGSFPSVMVGYLFDPGLLHIAGMSHKLCLPEEFASDILVLKLVSHRTIEKLGQLCGGNGGDVAVVCVTFYFMRLFLYAVNYTELSWEERTIYHFASLIWFTIFYRCAETMKTNQRNMFFESIGMLFLFPQSDFHNLRLATSESCKHTFVNYRKVEREFTVERLLQIEDMNWLETV